LLTAVEARLSAACSATGRSREDVVLVAVSKTRPAQDVAALAALGVCDVGENRDQEAAPKAGALADQVPGLRWHLVGQLQTNKARSVARYAFAVHSVDRPGLVEALAKGAQQAGRELDVLLQVSLSEHAGRGGAEPAEVPALADLTARAPGLRLAGVMAVAPLGADPERAFATLAEVSAQLRVDHPEATAISAGMSGDLEQAISHGATYVRVGTALFGSRPAALG